MVFIALKNHLFSSAIKHYVPVAWLLRIQDNCFVTSLIFLNSAMQHVQFLEQTLLKTMCGFSPTEAEKRAFL